MRNPPLAALCAIIVLLGVTGFAIANLTKPRPAPALPAASESGKKVVTVTVEATSTSPAAFRIENNGKVVLETPPETPRVSREISVEAGTSVELVATIKWSHTEAENAARVKITHDGDDLADQSIWGAETATEVIDFSPLPLNDAAPHHHRRDGFVQSRPRRPSPECHAQLALARGPRRSQRRGQDHPAQGHRRARADGDRQGRRPWRNRKNAIAYVPQREAVDWDFPITVRGLAEMGRYPSLGLWRKFGPEDDRIVEESLRVTELEAFADRQIKALSGGQQQRAFLARAWAQQAEIYLLDEPFTGLDRNAQEAFSGALHKLRESGKLIIASHHDLKSVPELFDHVLLINGELVASGPTGETFTTANIEKTFAMKIFSGSEPHHHHHHEPHAS